MNWITEVWLWVGWCGQDGLGLDDNTMEGQVNGKCYHLESGVSQDLEPSVESLGPVTCPRSSLFIYNSCHLPNSTLPVLRASPACPSGCFQDWRRAVLFKRA